MCFKLILQNYRIYSKFTSMQRVKTRSYTVAAYARLTKVHMNRDMRFPTIWYVRPAKPQTSLRICAV